MKQLLFWDFPRTSWRYDVVVALILAFIFLTPRGVFKDQPRAMSVVRVPVHTSAAAFWIDAELLTAAGDDARMQQAGEIISKKTGKAAKVLRLETILSGDDETQGYMAFVDGQ
jgi:hypothetical protein